MKMNNAFWTSFIFLNNIFSKNSPLCNKYCIAFQRADKRRAQEDLKGSPLQQEV